MLSNILNYRTVAYNDDALNDAVRNKRWERSRRLLKHRDAHRYARYRDAYGRDPLFYSCVYDAPLDVLSAIIELVEPRQASYTNSFGRTALHYACETASEESTLALLAFAPAAAAVEDLKGETPLHTAIHCRRSPRIVRSLLAHRPEVARGADPSPLWSLVSRWRSRPEREDGDDDDARRRAWPRGNRLDGRLDGRSTCRGSLLAIAEAVARGRVATEEEESTSSRRRRPGPSSSVSFFPAHETIVAGVVDGLLPRPGSVAAYVRLLDRSMRAECARPDANGDFPLHVACATRGVRT